MSDEPTCVLFSDVESASDLRIVEIEHNGLKCWLLFDQREAQ